MKLIYVLLLMAYIPCASAQGMKSANQDFCKQIVKDTSVDKTTFDFFSPYDRFSPTPMRITRSYTTDAENPYDNFNIVFQIMNPDPDNNFMVNDKGDRVEKEEKQIVIEFEDHTKIVNDSIDVNHDYSEDKTQSMRYAYFPVTDNNFKDLSTKKVVKFSLAGHEQVMPNDSTNSFQKYLECIKSYK